MQERNILSFMPYAEIIFISAETGQRIPRLFDELEIIIQNHSLRVATGVLNEILAEARFLCPLCLYGIFSLQYNHLKYIHKNIL